MNDKLFYRLRNWRSELHMALIGLGVFLGRVCGVLTMHGTLSATLIKADGTRVRFGVLGKRVVTDQGVGFLVDDWAGDADEINDMNFHDSGTGVGAEAVGDTDLGTPAGPTTRATGALSQPSANVLRSVGTINYTGALAITEHGLFNQSARGAGSELWDRTKFTAINVVSGDSIQFTYDCTINSGS